MNTAKLVSMICGALLLAGLVWSYGFLVGKGWLWPAGPVSSAAGVAESLVRYGDIVPENLRHTAPEGAARERFVVHDRETAIGWGYYAWMGWDDDAAHYKIWLHDAAGNPVHSWDIDPTSFSDAADTGSARPHGMEILQNGDVVVGFDWFGQLVRLNPCGRPVWQQDGYYHHVYQSAPDGNIWTWFNADSPTGQYQDIVKLDPETGETIKRIGLIEDIVTRSPEFAALFSLTLDEKFERDGSKAEDIFHPNDVEELSPEMAEAFPMFEAGDLLISLRNLDMVAVIDQEGNVKWTQQGPWRQQHDPDFLSDGTISVFNNSHAPGRTRSDIVSLDPATRKSRSLLGEWDVPFFTEYRGKHQMLPNGNMLLVIPEQGQVLEVTPEGEVAVELNNVTGPGSPFNDDVGNAAWFPEDYFDPLPNCS